MPEIRFLKNSPGARAYEIQPNGTKQFKQINIPKGTTGTLNSGIFKATINGKQYDIGTKMGPMNIYYENDDYEYVSEDPKALEGGRKKTRRHRKSKKSKRTRRH